eukprot:15190165-Alexandrium_andersonii.AAC.1
MRNWMSGPIVTRKAASKPPKDRLVSASAASLDVRRVHSRERRRPRWVACALNSAQTVARSGFVVSPLRARAVLP